MTGRPSLVGLAATAATILAAVVPALASRTPANARVPCGDIIGNQASGSLDGARVVLGLLSIPPARIQRGARTGTTPWSRFSKWGMVIHSGTAVELSVPRAWRRRVAITWGANTPIVSTLHFAPCRPAGGAAQPWNAYPGGFYMKTATACVPLIVTVGSRSRAVRFGIGESCRR